MFQEVGQPRGAAPFAGVLLHGRGIGPQGKVDLAARLGHLNGIRWIVPGSNVGSWYPNRFWDPIEANEPFLTEAVETCEEALEEASENGRLPPERLAVVGFSQGACIALEYALRHPGRCGTLIVFTGGLMGSPGTNPKLPAPSLKGLRVLLTGSDVDEWIPEQSTRETARVLENLGARVTLRIYPGRTHVVCDEELAEAQALLGTTQSQS
jgi:phospholipase/carboxylesterase